MLYIGTACMRVGAMKLCWSKCSSLAGVLDWQSGRFLDRQTKRIALLQCLNAVGSRESSFVFVIGILVVKNKWPEKDTTATKHLQRSCFAYIYIIHFGDFYRTLLFEHNILLRYFYIPTPDCYSQIGHYFSIRSLTNISFFLCDSKTTTNGSLGNIS